MKIVKCHFCGKWDPIDKMAIQTSLIKGLEQWVHVCCEAKMKELGA